MYGGEGYRENEAFLAPMRHAFGFLEPVREDYPIIPIEDGFNWAECASGLRMLSLYLVVFRSVRRPDADLELLREFDDRAYEDARHAPGFLFYFKGQVTPARECLSFCLWSTRERAREASRRPAHTSAASLVSRMYESYSLERHILSQRDGSLVFSRVLD